MSWVHYNCVQLILSFIEMAIIQHTIKFTNGSTNKDLVNDFNCVVLEGGTYPDIDKFKELQKNNWFDEDGDDVYIPSKRYRESFDVEIPIGCNGNFNVNTGVSQVKSIMKNLINWLSTGSINGGSGSLSSNGLTLEFPFYNKKYSGCYIKEIKDKDYSKMYTFEVFTCTLVFSVSNPNEL